jgi:sugar O-acyltransferase (sialic acid O-acetyltransferase NeuD family)
MKQIVVFGVGKIAEVFHSLAGDDTELTIAGFTCDRAFMTGSEVHGLPLVPFEDVETVFAPADFSMLVAIGYHKLNLLRADRCSQARAKGYGLASWVSRRAHVPKSCTIGENCVVMDGASLQPHARIGDDVFVWNGAVIGHHSTIGDHCWVASNCVISSTVTVEPQCFFGVNAAIGHGITIGARSIVGAGAVITHSTSADGVYVVGDTPRFRLDSQRFMRIARLL